MYGIHSDDDSDFKIDCTKMNGSEINGIDDSGMSRTIINETSTQNNSQQPALRKKAIVDMLGII